MVGDVILFEEHHLQPFGVDGEGLIDERHVLATVDPEADVIYPEGEWVLLDPDPAPKASEGGIYLADRTKVSPRSGVVLECGPGELRLSGPFAGLRRPVRAIWGLDQEEPLLDRRAYWERGALVYRCAGQVLVRARDIMALSGS